MPKYIVAYTLDDGTPTEYRAVEKAVCDASTSGQKRLDTTWVVGSRCKTSGSLVRKLRDAMHDDRKLGEKFVKNRLDLIVGMLDRESEHPASRINADILKEC